MVINIVNIYNTMNEILTDILIKKSENMKIVDAVGLLK